MRSKNQPPRPCAIAWAQGSFLPRAMGWKLGVLGLALLTFGQPISTSAQQTIHGEPGRPISRAVVNFSGLAEFEKLYKLEEKYKQNPVDIPPPGPRGTNGPPGGGGGGAPAPLAAPIPAPADNPFVAAAVPPLNSPAPTASFLAVPDNNTTLAPSPAGAVGPNHVMTALNSQVRIQNRNGGVISTVSLGTFWQALRPRNVFQPRLLYDPYANRWMFSVAADSFLPTASVLTAVSQTSDPTGNWFLFRVDADRNNLDYVDFISMGFNKDWIVVTANMFPQFLTNAVGYSGVNIYVFNKTNLYANGTGAFTALRDGSTTGFNIVPAATYDDKLSIMHLVEVDNLFHNFNRESSRLRLSTIGGPIGAEVLTLGAAFTTNNTDWASSELLSFLGGFAPQLGSPFLIDNWDSRIQNVVYRNGSLWCTHTVFLPTTLPTHSAVQWWQIATNGASIQFGRIEDTGGQTFYAFPSISVNRNEDALIGFSRFSATQFASANYAFRSCQDAPNTFRTDFVLKDGEAPYFRTGFATNFFFFLNRWGFYGSTVVDPVNDFDMWTVQEYAATPDFTSFIPDRWGTWWGRVSPVDTCFRIAFQAPLYYVNEATPGFASITVLNLGGAPGTVDFATADGTAVAGNEYLARTGTLVFASGQTETNFAVIILDNAAVHEDKTVLLTLSNPTGIATLGQITNATLVIQDDETLTQGSTAGEFNFSSFQNGGAFYVASEFESFIAPCGRALYTFFAPERDVPGVLVTVVRTNGSSGRVMVDFETAEGGTGTPFVDFTPVNGTLIFDDYQMSTNFMVEVFPQTFFSLFGTGSRFIRVLLSNPRPAPEEEALRPGVIRPRLGLGSESGIIVYDAFRDPFTLTNNVFSFERRNWRSDEYSAPTDVGGTRIYNIQVLKPDAMGGRVILRTRESPGRRTLFSPFFLQAGSDFAESPGAGTLSSAFVWPNPIITDPGLNPIINLSDYQSINVILQFDQRECRKNITLVITNEPTVEFNEDIMLELVQINGEPIVNTFLDIASLTILYNNQPAGAVDREWNAYNVAAAEADLNFNRTPGANNTVRALAVQADGKTVVGGDFDRINGVRRPGIGRMHPNGAVDRFFTPGDGVNGFVTSIVLYSANSFNNGRILIGGGFSAYDSQERSGIARLLPDGQLDPAFFPGSGANGPVWGVALQSDEKVIVVGSFTAFNDIPRNGVARLNQDGSIDLSFDVGSGADATIWTVGVSPSPVGDKILIGGDFSSFNGEFQGAVARLNLDGSVDQSFLTGSGANGSVYALAVQTNGAVVIAGSFSEIDAKSRVNIARLNFDGSLDPNYDSGFGPDGPILALTLQPDQKAIIGGPFTVYNATRRMGFARLRLNGTLDTSFLDTAYNQFAGLIKTLSYEPPNFVNAVAVQPDGNVMIGGSFTNLGGNPSYRFPLRNSWTVYTRSDKQIRYNIARVLGGATPGPGNVEFDSPEFFVDENAGIGSIRLQRTDGRLGTLTAIADATDRVASNKLDFVTTNLVASWDEKYLSFPPVLDVAPLNVGEVAPSHIRIGILDDLLQEGDETVNLSFIRPEGSLNLAGENVPLGGALGLAKATLTIGDNDFDRGILNFATPNFVTNENTISAIINVIRTNGSVGAVSVDYYTRNSTNTPIATPNVDYRPVPKQTLTFASGQTSRTFTVPLIDDNIVEFDENIELVLTNATGGARLPGRTPTSIATATLTLIDNDFPAGRLNFALSSFTTNESAGAATIAVTRTGGNLGAVSVQYMTLDGTANAPADYATTTGTLSWDDADTTPRTFTVPLVLDNQVDNPTNRFESVILRLFNPRLGTVANQGLLGIRTNVNLFIEDADAYGTLAFNQSFYQADENAGSATVTVVRKNGLAGVISAQIGVVAVDPLSPGLDYVPTNGVLTFQPGESSKSFTIPLLDDPDGDGNKDLVLSLSNPFNATLGLPNPVILTLIDNESFNVVPGELDTSFSTNAQVNGPIYSLALQPDGRILLAGEFTEVANVNRAGVARLQADGLFDATFDAGSGPNGAVRATALQPDGKLLVGGFFSQFNSTNRNGLLRLNSDGTVYTVFNIGSGANNPVYAIALQPNDKVLVAGAFSTFNGISRPGIVRLHTNGVVDATFVPGSGANNTIYALGLQSDGKIVVCGDFTQFNGFPRSRIARLNPDGSLDLTFNPGATLNAAGRAVIIQPDGRPLVGGSFTSANGVQRNYLARFNGDGTLDNSFLGVGLVGGDNAVFALAQQVDGKILVAGDFRSFNGVTRNRLTRLNLDGSTDPTINFGNGADSFIAALVVQPDRKIVIGGGFTKFDDRTRRRIARIHGGSIAGPGAIEFVQAEFLTQENATNALITARRRYGTMGNVSVNYQSVNGTAIAGVHYQAAAGTLNFASGETRQSFSIPIFDNNGNNDDLRFTLELLDGTFTGGATNGPQPVARVVILDDEGAISFSATSYNVGENAASGLAPINVVRRGGTNFAVTVDFGTVGGTATAFLDYFPTNGVMTFLPGETNKLFHVRLVNDANIEPNETVLLSLSNPGRSNVLVISSAELVISDNDFGPGQFVFSPTAYSVIENAGQATLTVLRTNGSSGVASVRLSTFNNTATAGIDYGGTNLLLAFADGEIAKEVQISIIDDLLVELTESFNAVLSNPSGGAGLGVQTNASVTILDDDVSAILPAGSRLINESGPVNNIIDPNETVTMGFSLRNVGSGNTIDLVATLLPGNGVSMPSSPQPYGVLLANGPAVERQFTFKAVGNPGDRLVATLLLTDSGSTNGSAAFAFTLGGQATRTFTSTNRITINDTNTASPYPSTINIANMGGTITKVTVTLSNLSHTFPDDVDILLVSPGGEKVLLMSDAGSSTSSPNPINNVTLTLDAAAPVPLPDSTPITSGTYRPANYAGLGTADAFPPPAPPFPYTNTSLALLNGLSPNGNWSLYIVDDTSNDNGSLGGWSINIQTSDPVSPAPNFAVANLRVNATGTPGPVPVGSQVSSAFHVSNVGPGAATEVSLLNQMPPGLVFRSASASGGTWRRVGGTLMWTVGSLPPGGLATLTVNATPTAPGTLVNPSTVTGSQQDPNLTDNSATVVTTVVEPPVLRVTRVGNTVRVAWPVSTGFKLQVSDSPRAEPWTDQGGSPQVVDGQNVVTVEVAPGTAKFYRLSTQ